MQYRLANAQQDISNTNHVGLSDSLGRPAAASDCTDSIRNYMLVLYHKMHNVASF